MLCPEKLAKHKVQRFGHFLASDGNFPVVVAIGYHGDFAPVAAGHFPQCEIVGVLFHGHVVMFLLVSFQLSPFATEMA